MRVNAGQRSADVTPEFSPLARSLTPEGQPTWRYRFGAATVAEEVEPIVRVGGGWLARRMTVNLPPEADHKGYYARIAVGESVVQEEDGVWAITDSQGTQRIRVLSGSPMVRIIPGDLEGGTTPRTTYSALVQTRRFRRLAIHDSRMGMDLVMKIVPTLALAAPLAFPVLGQNAPQGDESKYYTIQTYPIPEDIVLEVSGLTLLPDGRPLVATRRGEVFVVDDAFTGDVKDVKFKRWLEGFRSVSACSPMRDGWVYLTQRGELSRARDSNGDDRADEVETVCELLAHQRQLPRVQQLRGPRHWARTVRPVDHHQQAPSVTSPSAVAPWRGFARAHHAARARCHPGVACGPALAGRRRRPAPGATLFYTDNQGEWCGASKLSHLIPGSFHGHPHGIAGTDLPEWKHARPADPPNRKLMPVVAAEHEQFQMPACWFPYDEMGRSPAGFVWDQTGGRFGPVPRAALRRRSVLGNRPCVSRSSRWTAIGRAPASRSSATLRAGRSAAPGPRTAHC